MEMDSVELDENGFCSNGTPDYELLSEDPSDTCDIFGDPEILPRVGEEYQVDVPCLMRASEYSLYTKDPIDDTTTQDFPRDFLIGVSIETMWITNKVENTVPSELPENSKNATNINGSLESKSIKEPKTYSRDKRSKLKAESSLKSSNGMRQEMRRDPSQLGWEKDYYLVPGTIGESWSELDEASFLLGLYIFGKNLVQVKRFMETKNMGDILSFYFGKFFKSERHRRWLECRKVKSRKCIYGQRIFNGSRLQELLSRFLPHLSEQQKKTMLEASQTFGEGKMLLEEYVSILKSVVGMNLFVEAVAIGKGKQDLTGMSMEPVRPNPPIQIRPEIPIGKACASLSRNEIVNFLTGDFRLSKARSNDLFWEAVWPLLLERGWHSEQPKNHTSKHALVFLMPGIKKFSRRRLTKGTDYFDSVSDVLNKIALDPGLLQLETEEDKAKVDQDELPEPQPHCYLQPRTSNRNTNLMKFTIVDTTSITNGEERRKVTEVRSLPANSLSKNDTETSDEPDDESSSSDREDDNTSKTVTGFGNGLFKPGIRIIEPDSTTESTKIPKKRNSDLGDEKKPRKPIKVILSQKTDLCDEKKLRKPIKDFLSQTQKLEPESLSFLAPFVKRRRRLNACGNAKPNSCLMRLKQEETASCSENMDSSENVVCHDRLSSAGSSSRASPVKSAEPVGPTRELIDLNLPHIPQDVETDEPFVVEGTKDARTTKQPPESSTSVVATEQQQQPDMNSRRQSTRNRPPTAKALEALASGFFSPKRMRREDFPGKKSKSRRSVSRNLNSKAVEETGNGLCRKSDIRVNDDFQDHSDGDDGTQDSGL